MVAVERFATTALRLNSFLNRNPRQFVPRNLGLEVAIPLGLSQRGCRHRAAHPPGGSRNSSPNDFAISITRGMACGCCGSLQTATTRHLGLEVNAPLK